MGDIVVGSVFRICVATRPVSATIVQRNAMPFSACTGGTTMAVIVRDEHCTSCGNRHTLCLPDADTIYSIRAYEYDCPSTKRTVRLPKDDWGEVVPACPPDALI